MDDEAEPTTEEPRLLRSLSFDEKLAILNSRYRALDGAVLTIAFRGVVRHLRACKRLGLTPKEAESIAAISEIIADAKAGRAVYAEPTPNVAGEQAGRFLRGIVKAVEG